MSIQHVFQRRVGHCLRIPHAFTYRQTFTRILPRDSYSRAPLCANCRTVDNPKHGLVYDIQQTDDIAAHFEAHGYVVARVLDNKECIERVCELWTNVIQRQPWRRELRLAIGGADGRELDANKKDDRAEFARVVTGPLDCQTRTTFEKGWSMHATFGAPCDNRSFHTKLIWEVRQNRHMYEAAAAMTGERCLWVDINRSIMKLPGKGDNEFLHWDYDIFSDNPLATIGPATIQGKIMYTVGDFVCVPGSHTEQFKQQFRHEYDALYPNRKITRQSSDCRMASQTQWGWLVGSTRCLSQLVAQSSGARYCCMGIPRTR